jgi:glyoxylase I family protein
MPTPIVAGPIHHLRLTVSDVARSQAFYTEVLGFDFIMDLPSGVFLSNGAVGLGLGPSPDPSRAPVDDRFDEARVGLDHLSFSVVNRAELERAQQLLDERGFRTVRSLT